MRYSLLGMSPPTYHTMHSVYTIQERTRIKNPLLVPKMQFEFLPIAVPFPTISRKDKANVLPSEKIAEILQFPISCAFDLR